MILMLLRFLEKLKDTIIFLVEIPVVLFRYVGYMFGFLVYNKIFLATKISLEYGNSSPIRIKRQQPKQRTDNDFGLGMHVVFFTNTTKIHKIRVLIRVRACTCLAWCPLCLWLVLVLSLSLHYLHMFVQV